jgi:hypothetical protein
MTEVSETWVEYHAKVASAYDQAGMEYFKSQPERVEINLTAEESARWVQAVAAIKNKKIADIKAKGLPGDDYEIILMSV